MSNNLSELSNLFGYCSTSTEELIKPAEAITEPIQEIKPERVVEYYQIPDHATMDLGYCKTWHDLIDIQVPLGRVPQALLMPRVPLPLHHQNPRNILTKIDKHWWNRTRVQVYEVQDQRCAICGTHKMYQMSKRKQLEAHEMYDIDYKTGTVKLLGILPLCPECHKLLHYGMLTAWLESGMITPTRFQEYIDKGDRLLLENGLPMKNWDASVNDNKYNIPWNDWKLVLTINGIEQEFHSLYKDEEDLMAHY